MKKVFLSVFACVCAVCCFTGCADDDDDGASANTVSAIEASVENGSSYNSRVDVVKALMDVDEEYDSETGEYYFTGYEAATANYSNGSFKLNLPQSVNSQYLFSITEDLSGDISVSDKNAKIGSVEFILGYKNGVETGMFEYGYDTDDASAWTTHIYADSDVTVTGSESEKEGNTTYNYVYNMSLKKGWNVVYVADAKKGNTWTITFSGKKPSGMKWIFYDYEEDPDRFSLSLPENQTLSSTSLRQRRLR